MTLTFYEGIGATDKVSWMQATIPSDNYHCERPCTIGVSPEKRNDDEYVHQRKGPFCLPATAFFTTLVVLVSIIRRVAPVIKSMNMLDVYRPTHHSHETGICPRLGNKFEPVGSLDWECGVGICARVKRPGGTESDKLPGSQSFEKRREQIDKNSHRCTWHQRRQYTAALPSAV